MDHSKAISSNASAGDRSVAKLSLKTFGLVVGSALGGVAMTLMVQWARKRLATKKPPKKKTPPGELLDPDYGFRFVRVKDIVYPPWADDQEQAIEELRSQNWLVPGDIVVATYPKAGTTLMQQVVMLLLNQGNPELVGDVMDTSPWVEREYCTAKNRGLTRAKAFDIIKGTTTGGGSRRVIKTHAPFELFPAASIPDGVKVICVVRDPRDVCVSMHKHYKGIPRFQYSGPMDHFVKLFVEGNVGHGCFFRHLESWWKGYKSEGPEKIMWLKYEDLIGDKTAVVKRVADFIGQEANEELINKVCQGSAIDSMRERAATKKGAHGSATHFNKGVSGNWKKVLTVNQAQALNRHCTENLAKLGDVDLSFEG